MRGAIIMAIVLHYRAWQPWFSGPVLLQLHRCAVVDVLVSVVT